VPTRTTDAAFSATDLDQGGGFFRLLAFHAANPRTHNREEEGSMTSTDLDPASTRATQPPAHFDLRKITTPILLHLTQSHAIGFPTTARLNINKAASEISI